VAFASHRKNQEETITKQLFENIFPLTEEDRMLKTQEAKSLLDSANRQFEDGEYIHALEAYLRIVVGFSEFLSMGHIYYRIGVLYTAGRFCALADLAKAAHYLKLAHELLPKETTAEALCDLGFLYNNALGVIADISLAFMYYQQSAAMGYRRAQFNLACMYYTGHGTPKDEKKALHYFTLAGNAGEKDAMFQAGLLFEAFKDYQNAIGYLLRAVSNRHKNAHKHLKRIFKGKRGDLIVHEAKSYLSYNWPQTHYWLSPFCTDSILDTVLCLQALPAELRMMISKIMILHWPTDTLTTFIIKKEA